MSKRGGSQGPKGAKAPAKKAAAKVSPRSAAATKAAATRKANQERKEKEAKKLLAELDRWEKKQKAKRSEAAKKGAETRKAKKAAAETQKEKRSAAAKKGAATKAAKKAAPAPAKKAPAKKAPAGKLIHAGIKYRRKTHRDTKGTDNLRFEIAIELKAGIETPSPQELNAGMQTYAISRGKTLPSWAKRVDVAEWAHAKGRPQFAEDKAEISEALEDFANVIAESEFQLMGGD